MKVEHVEVLVEEPSMETALRHLIPKLIGDVSFGIFVHQGKTDLLERLPERFRGYARFVEKSWRIVVLVDRDDEDCLLLKDRLENLAKNAGLTTKTSATDDYCTVINRIAIEELEAWYFGDWEAVKIAYPKVPSTIPFQAKYRQPDQISGGTWEAFERVAKRAGYFEGGLRKIEAAQKISCHMDPSRNTSQSFRAFRKALSALA